MDADQSTDSFRTVFDEVVELPVDQREDFLNRACCANLKLRAAVESLLSAHDRAGAFLADPAVPADIFEASEQIAPGSRIGRYLLIRILGEGGYGRVYLAEQDAPLRRRVALKVIKPGMDTQQVIARFEQERQALAVMEHTNIARIFDAGSTTAGRPFFVMELVDGIPITDFCQQFALDIEPRLQLFIAICNAVHHAHEKGIIHRDLKPGNVLVVMQDGTPVPKVIDFGIAKALFSSNDAAAPAAITLQPQFLGTPQYMSPEQARIPVGQVDWRSDIYSLGALLYEILTDLPPFDRDQFRHAAYGEISHILQEIDPVPPSKRLAAKAQPASSESDRLKHVSRIRGNLDRIVHKAMEKDPTHRYASAADLAADVERHQSGEPIDANRFSWPRRMSRILHRHRRAVIAAALLLVVSIVGISLQMRKRPPAPVVSAVNVSSPLEPGLFAQLYADSHFDVVLQTRIDSDIDFAWPKDHPPSPLIKPPHYGIRWTGVLVVPPEGISAIGAAGNDGVRLLLDSKEIVNFNKPHKALSDTPLSPGRHTIQLDYWNHFAEGSVTLLWVRSGNKEEVVPASALFHHKSSNP